MMKQRHTGCIVSVILVMLAILVFSVLFYLGYKEVMNSEFLFPGRDTYLDWADGRYELSKVDEKYYSLWRWKSKEGKPGSVNLSGHVIRFYIADDYSYFEAEEGFMVIDHSTHEYPVFVEFSDLALQHQAVFNQSSLFKSRMPQ